SWPRASATTPCSGCGRDAPRWWLEASTTPRAWPCGPTARRWWWTAPLAPCSFSPPPACGTEDHYNKPLFAHPGGSDVASDVVSTDSLGRRTQPAVGRVRRGAAGG